MPRIYVEFARMKQVGSSCKSVSSNVDQIRSDFQRTIGQLDWDVKYQSDINSTATQLARKLEGYTQALKSYQSFIDNTYEQYAKLDAEKFEVSLFEKSAWDKFVEEFSSNYGWGDFLSGAGYIGTI